MVLPEDLVKEIYYEVGATADSSGNVLVACKQSSSKSYFSFGFGGPNGVVISVSMSELVLPTAIGKLSSGPNKGEDACLFHILPISSNSPVFILGDAFLRSAYVVYDLVNNEVGMAQTVFNATSSNVVEFASSGASIPNSTPAPNQEDADMQAVAVTATPTAYAASDGFMSVASGMSRPVMGRVILTGCAVVILGFCGLL